MGRDEKAGWSLSFFISLPNSPPYLLFYFSLGKCSPFLYSLSSHTHMAQNFIARRGKTPSRPSRTPDPVTQTFRDSVAPNSTRARACSCTDGGAGRAVCIWIFRTNGRSQRRFCCSTRTSRASCSCTAVRCPFGEAHLFYPPSKSGCFPLSLKMQRKVKIRHSSAPLPCKRSLCVHPTTTPPHPIFSSPSLLFCLSLSLTQLRVLGGNPASHPEAHPLPHSLGLPSQPGRLHAAEASWPSPPAPAESQRHVMPGGCPPARSPPLPRGPR